MQTAEWEEDFATAWRLMDGLLLPNPWPAPSIMPWDGRSLTSTDVLHVWKRFRDIGADIRHASMFADLERLNCSRVVVETDPRLIPLFKRSFPRLAYAPRGILPQPDATVTVHATHERLGLLFRSGHGDFSTSPGFLLPEPNLVIQAHRAHAREGLPLVGFSWASTNAAKSLPTLEEWLPVLRRTPASFVSLQYGDVDQDIAFLRNHGIDIVMPSDLDLLNDFDGLAALIAACDAVITISNTTAHLAGAVGTATVVVIRDAPILAWPRNKQRTVWYPAIRLAWCPSEVSWMSWMMANSEELWNMTLDARF